MERLYTLATTIVKIKKTKVFAGLLQCVVNRPPQCLLINVRTVSCGYGYSVSLSGMLVLYADNAKPFQASPASVGTFLVLLLCVLAVTCMLYVSGSPFWNTDVPDKTPCSILDDDAAESLITINAGCLIANT